MSVAVRPPEVTRYLVSLDRALVGPRRAKRSLVDEAADHLEDAVGAYSAAGYDAPAAAAQAVRDFGTIDEVAHGFQTTLAVAASRRTAALLLGILAVQPLLWDGGLELAPPAETRPDGGVYAALDVGIEVVGGLIMVGAVLALAAATIGHRWLLDGRVTARVTAVFTLAATFVIPTMALGMAVLAGLVATPHLWAGFVPLVFLPMATAALSARRTLAAC